ncbi:type II secretion system minor pseudopilin GspK [Alkanindiges sp. WGS2144]|uniref:type II secretion system minor pseudopilin GspK n=1 Tax=Alkanindiges sp. WGS2144 TaxID=3366808 RepID=UPI003751411B
MRTQQGVALLTILFMVVIASIMVMGILNQQQRMVREGSILLRQDQAWVYAKSGEYFLSELLVNYAKNSKDNDNLSEQWAQPLPAFPVEDGSVSGRLIDQSSKFNLNNLYHDGKPDKEAFELFQRLLKRVGLPADLAESVLDWQDPDDVVTGAMGAEDSFYLGQQPAYLAANRPFIQVEELRQVRGFDLRNYNLIAPYVTAVPYFSPINVNTAPAMLLSALSDDLQLNQVQEWVTQRDKSQQYLSQAAELWNQPGFSQLSGSKPPNIDRLIAIKSEFFHAQIVVNLSGRKRYLSSQLYRQGEQVMAYQRHQMPIADLKTGEQNIEQLLQQFATL